MNSSVATVCLLMYYFADYLFRIFLPLYFNEADGFQSGSQIGISVDGPRRL